MSSKAGQIAEFFVYESKTDPDTVYNIGQHSNQVARTQLTHYALQ